MQVAVEWLNRQPSAPAPRFTAGSPGSGTAELMRLQGQVGNAAVTQLIQRQQAAGAAELEEYELTLPEFVGVARLASAKVNEPAMRRETDPSGAAVYAVQKALIKAGHKLPRSTRPNRTAPEQESPDDPAFTDLRKDPDGRWGAETDRELYRFQVTHGLSPDMRVGNKTLKKLQEAAGSPVPQPILAPGTEVAGVESFTVHYDRDPTQDGRVKIDIDAVFTDDAAHDPEQAEVQQWVSSRATLTRPDGTVTEVDRRNVHDDGYHRDPDRINDRAQKYDGNTYHATDEAGFLPTPPDAELDLRFTAEQRIVDLARNEMVIARRGPHTVIVTGTTPHDYDGAPQDL